MVSFIHSSVSLTTGPQPLPKPVLHTVRSSASSFNSQNTLVSLRSSNICLRLLLASPPLVSFLLFNAVYGNNHCLFSDPHKTLCEQTVELVSVKLVVQIMTNGLYRVNIQSAPRRKHTQSVIKTSQLMLYREIIAVCSEIHTKHINIVCGQNVELLNVKLVVHTVTTVRYI